MSITIKPKITGTAVITHRCWACGQLITEGEPVFVHEADGRIYAYHPEHHKEMKSDGR